MCTLLTCTCISKCKICAFVPFSYCKQIRPSFSTLTVSIELFMKENGYDLYANDSSIEVLYVLFLCYHAEIMFCVCMA